MYLGDNIQNVLIDLIGSKIKNTILDLVRKYKYYSIILDCTPDVSHMEQWSVILRFVLLNEFTKKIEICEHFIRFVLLLIQLMLAYITMWQIC